MGNPVIPNVISHYEFISKARDILRERNKYVFANGVFVFAPANDWSRLKLYNPQNGSSRFFIASLCDLAGCELGAATPMWEMLIYRTYMGKKPYVLLNSERSGIDNYFKRGLLMDIFTSYTFTHLDRTDLYYINLLHKEYLPLMRLLYHSGWEPETGVTGLDDVYCERYGNPSMGKTYIVVYNDGSMIKNLTLKLDGKIFKNQIVRATNIFGTNQPYRVLDNKIKVKLGPGEIKLFEII
jgi:hypothetical protein